MPTQLTLVVSLVAKPGLESELGQRLHALVTPTRAEAGCINYDLHRSNDDPAVWMIHENWRSQTDLDEHFRTPYLERFLAGRHEVLARDMDIGKYSLQPSPSVPLAVGT